MKTTDFKAWVKNQKNFAPDTKFFFSEISSTIYKQAEAELGQAQFQLI